MCVGWPMQILDAAETAAVLSALHGHAGGDEGACVRGGPVPTCALLADHAPDGDGDAPVLARGRGRVEHVDLRLVGRCAPGDWVLVYQGAARERLDAERAAEIHAALDLLEQGLAGAHDLADADPGFALPSAMSAAQLAALAGGPVGAADSASDSVCDSARGDDSLCAHTPSPEPHLERP